MAYLGHARISLAQFIRRSLLIKQHIHAISPWLFQHQPGPSNMFHVPGVCDPSQENSQGSLGILLVELHWHAHVLVYTRCELLMEGLFLFQTGDKDFKELFECSDGQVLPAVIINGHLFDLWVLFDQLSLLLLEGGLALSLFTLCTLRSLTWFILVGAASTLGVLWIIVQ